MFKIFFLCFPKSIYCVATVLCCTLLYSAVLCCTRLHSAALCCTLLYEAALCCTLLYSTVLYCTVLYSVLVGCTVLYSTVLYSIYSDLLIIPNFLTKFRLVTVIYQRNCRIVFHVYPLMEPSHYAL